MNVLNWQLIKYADNGDIAHLELALNIDQTITFKKKKIAYMYRKTLTWFNPFPCGK